jgi:hypothetical protein
MTPTMRVVGRALKVSFHPDDVAPAPTAAQGETINVWGRRAQADLVASELESSGSEASVGSSRGLAAGWAHRG